MIALTAIIAKREREARRREAESKPTVHRWRPTQWPPILRGLIRFRKRGDNGKTDD
jgi:hypothetical protein